MKKIAENAIKRIGSSEKVCMEGRYDAHQNCMHVINLGADKCRSTNVINTSTFISMLSFKSEYFNIL